MRNLDGVGASPRIRGWVVNGVRNGDDLLLDAAGESGARLLDEAEAELAESCRVVRVRAGASGLSLSGLMAQLAGVADFTAQDDAILERVYRRIAVPDAEGGRIALLVSGADRLQRPALRFLQHIAGQAKSLVLVLAGGSDLAQVLEPAELSALRGRLLASAAPPAPLAEIAPIEPPRPASHLPGPASTIRLHPDMPRPELAPRMPANPSLSRRGWASRSWALLGLGVAASLLAGTWVARSLVGQVPEAVTAPQPVAASPRQSGQNGAPVPYRAPRESGPVAQSGPAPHHGATRQAEMSLADGSVPAQKPELPATTPGPGAIAATGSPAPAAVGPTAGPAELAAASPARTEPHASAAGDNRRAPLLPTSPEAAVVHSAATSATQRRLPRDMPAATHADRSEPTQAVPAPLPAVVRADRLDPPKAGAAPSPTPAVTGPAPAVAVLTPPAVAEPTQPVPAPPSEQTAVASAGLAGFQDALAPAPAHASDGSATAQSEPERIRPVEPRHAHQQIREARRGAATGFAGLRRMPPPDEAARAYDTAAQAGRAWARPAQADSSAGRDGGAGPYIGTFTTDPRGIRTFRFGG